MKQWETPRGEGDEEEEDGQGKGNRELLERRKGMLRRKRGRERQEREFGVAGV
jgi:hypothetical protein